MKEKNRKINELQFLSEKKRRINFKMDRRSSALFTLNVNYKHFMGKVNVVNQTMKLSIEIFYTSAKTLIKEISCMEIREETDIVNLHNTLARWLEFLFK